MKIHFENVSKRFRTKKGPVEAVADLTLTIEDGEFFIFLGPSGCGKSTVLNLAAGLEEPSSGAIRFGDAVVASADQKTFIDPGSRNVAMVFQTYALYPHMNVYENIAFPLRNARKPDRDVDPAVRDAAAMLDIESLLDRKPGELSGGQRQRVAIARALVRQPAVFLLDEPLSNLDAQLRTSTRAELKKLQKETGITTLYVTHDQTEAMALGDRVALLRNGRTVQVGTPEQLYNEPATPFAAAFLGAPPMNLIPGVLKFNGSAVSAEFQGQRIELPPRLKKKAESFPTSDICIGIRPERIRIVSEKETGRLGGKITTKEPLGRDVVYRIDLSGFEILAASEDPGYRPGQTIGVIFDAEDVHLFAAECREEESNGREDTKTRR